MDGRRCLSRGRRIEFNLRRHVSPIGSIGAWLRRGPTRLPSSRMRRDHHETEPLERPLSERPKMMCDRGESVHPEIAEAKRDVVALDVLEFIALRKQTVDLRLGPVHGEVSEPLAEVAGPLAPRLLVVEIAEPERAHRQHVSGAETRVGREAMGERDTAVAFAPDFT